MTGIDPTIVSQLAARLDSLTANGVGSFSNPAAALPGESGQAAAAPAPTVLPHASAEPSVQTVLSAVALMLAAILRTGRDAMPVVLGNAPIWPEAPVNNAVGATQFQTRLPSESTGAQNNPPSAATKNAVNEALPGAEATRESQGVSADGQTIPVRALAAALASTVADSGLFYESHLVQWLTGQRAPETLAAEPQNRLSSSGTPAPQPTRGGAQSAQTDLESLRWLDASTTLAGWGASRAAAHDSGQSAQASGAPPIHPAAIQLVRQQLDVLATNQFHWTGDVWPGARLDWLIEPDGRQPDTGGAGAVQQSWRTRLMLALPTLGTIDADLSLTGKRLVARVHASAEGASWLSAQREALRRSLNVSGLELDGLTILEIESSGASNPAAAMSAYARADATPKASGERGAA